MGHFLFTCSDAYAIWCIDYPQYISSQTADRRTDRQTDRRQCHNSHAYSRSYCMYDCLISDHYNNLRMFLVLKYLSPMCLNRFSRALLLCFPLTSFTYQFLPFLGKFPLRAPMSISFWPWPWFNPHPSAWMHGATLRRHSDLFWAATSTSSQMIPILNISNENKSNIYMQNDAL